MVIGRGLNDDASYIKYPKIGSPDIKGDLKNANLIKSAARSISIDDIEDAIRIKTVEQKIDATYYCRQQFTNPHGTEWYYNYFDGYFNTNNRPENDIQIPTLTGQGYSLGKPLYTYYNVHINDPDLSDMSDTLKNLIFKWNWVASRCVHSQFDYSRFIVRNIYTSYIYAQSVCYGYTDSIGTYNFAAPIRPIISLQSENQIKTTTKTGYKWEVNQD